jgi:hypothetical protein
MLQPDFHCAIMIVDVENFGDPTRTNAHQVAVRDALYRALQESFARAGISWEGCKHEDRGDGVLILVRPPVPKSLLVTSLPACLAEMLARHNASCPVQERIRLRMALHAGELLPDAHGVTGTSLNQAFRLIDAPVSRTALRDSSGVMVLIVSDWFHEEVVRNHVAARPNCFLPVHVVMKETEMTAWVRVLEAGESLVCEEESGQEGLTRTGPMSTRRLTRRWVWTAATAILGGVVAVAAVVYFGWSVSARTSARPPAASHSSTHSRTNLASPTAAAAPPAALSGSLEFSHLTIAAGLHSNGAYDVFGLDPQGHVIHSVMGSTTGNWGPWTPFGPDGTAQAITVAAGSNQLLHVMAVLADGSIEERSEKALNQWGDWQPFAPTGTAKVLALGQDRYGDLEAFAVTPGGQLISRKQLSPGGSNWSGWEHVNLPGTVQSVAATQKIDGYLDVMAVTTDGSVEWEDEDQTGWRPWVLFGPPGTAVQVSIGQNADGLEDVFALTPAGTISSKYQEDDPGHPWSAWQPDFGPSCAAASVNVGAQDQQRLAVLAICTDGTMHDVFEPQPNAPWIGGWKVFGPAGGFGVGSPSP